MTAQQVQIVTTTLSELASIAVQRETAQNQALIRTKGVDEEDEEISELGNMDVESEGSRSTLSTEQKKDVPSVDELQQNAEEPVPRTAPGVCNSFAVEDANKETVSFSLFILALRKACARDAQVATEHHNASKFAADSVGGY